MQVACAVASGAYHPAAVVLLTAAAGLLATALTGLPRGARAPHGAVLGVVLLLVGHGALAMIAPLSAERPASSLTLVPLAMFGLGITYLARSSPLLAAARFAAIVALGAVLGAQVIHASPHPQIDVFAMQRDGADALLAGRNPYASVAVADTNPWLAQPRTVPYTYPPVQLAITTLARAVAGDVRWAMVAALIAAAIAARQAARRIAPDAPPLQHDAPALVILGGPLTAFVIEQAWVDPVPLGLLAIGLWAVAARRAWLAAIVLGVACASKQTLALLVLLLPLVPGFTRRHVAVALAAGAATVLPFVVWDPAAFWRAAVHYFAVLPVRGDALTLSNLIRQRFGWAPGELAGLAAAGVAAAALWRRLPRAGASFGLLSGLVLLSVFLFGRLAFANYYFFLSGLVAISAALVPP
jgi:hypothetical protein